MAFMRVPHITRRDVAVVFVTALACYGIAAATTGASSPRHHHFYTAPGDLISVRAVDLLCHVYANDPTHHEYSPALFCVRASKPGSSRAFGATNNYAWMDGQNTRSVEDRFARKP